jgi:hypothetical protein
MITLQRNAQTTRVVISPVWAHDHIQLVMMRRLLTIGTDITCLMGEESDKYRGAK